MTAIREIKLLNFLNHPNIIKTYGVINSKRNYQNNHRKSTFLLLEYMEHDFWSLLKNNKFNQAEIKCLLKQLLEGIAYLHSKNIIHRDLKGGNLLMNNRGCLKIADFGLARRFTRETRKSHNVVTFWYRAPELLLGVKDYNEKIDIWSVGCIFAEFLTGSILFRGKKIKDQLQCIYEKLGNPLPKWKKVNQTKLWKEMKPTRKYEPGLRHFILKHNKRVDESTLDLLSRLLEYNPKQRISAKDALDHEYFFKHPLPSRKEEIRKFKDEFHELNSKSKPRLKISERMVMNDYKKIKTLEILEELYKKYESKQKNQFQNKNFSNGSDRFEPEFSSESEHLNHKIKDHWITGEEMLDKSSNIISKKLEKNESAEFSEAFFSDEEKDWEKGQIPSNKSDDQVSLLKKQKNVFKNDTNSNNFGEKIESTDKLELKKKEDVYNLDWIN